MPSPSDTPQLSLRIGVENFPKLCAWFKSLDGGDNPVRPLWDLGEQLEEFKKQKPKDFRGAVPPESFFDEWAKSLAERVAAGSPYLPLAYKAAYAAPLSETLAHVVRAHDSLSGAHVRAETLVGAVAQHLPESPVRSPVRQFLAVVSNLYRSFLDPDKRVSAKVPLSVPILPPLVMFHHGKLGKSSGETTLIGPAAFTTRMTRLLCGSDVAIIILPAGLHRAPLAWAPLAHETTGHGVLQADPELLPDLTDGVRTLFGAGPLAPGAKPNDDQSLALLWSHWLEEAASDVYGVLNIGPAFALNLAAFLAGRRSEDPTKPQLLVNSIVSGALAPHPVDILRLYVAAGAIETLTGLSQEHVRFYVDLLDRIAKLCGKNAWEMHGPVRKVVVRGQVPVERDRAVLINLSLPIAEAAAAARRVGAFIASTRLGAFGNKTVQDIETWDDADEAVAQTIMKTLYAPPIARIQEPGAADPDRTIPVPIMEALTLLLPTPPTETRVEEVGRAFKGARFEDLTTEELGALFTTVPVPEVELREALKADRVEAFIDPKFDEKKAQQTVAAYGLDLIASLGDDGQLLAGATLAALLDPSKDSLRWINQRLAYALIHSHWRDAVFGSAELHQLVDPTPLSVGVVSVTPPAVPLHLQQLSIL